MKIFILDSGPIINLSMNGLLYILEELKKISDIKIIITEAVKKEIIDRPMQIPRFELGAIRVEKMMEDKIIELPESIGVKKDEILKKTAEIMEILNSTIKIGEKYVNIVSEAECSCLALSKILTAENINNIIGIDERTTRTIFEKPDNLIKLMSKKLRKKVYLHNKEFKKLGNFRFIRSSEIVYVAHKKSLTNITGKKALEALIYATKYKGCSISQEEINELKKM